MSGVGTSVNNLDQINSLTENHVLTSVKGCSDSNNKIEGIQVTYGLWSEDEVTETVELASIGDLTGNCDVYEI